MLTIFYGTDRVRVRTALNEAVDKAQKGTAVVRITDAHSLEDLSAVMQGGGMFAIPRVVVLEYLLSREDMRAILESTLNELHSSTEQYYLLEEKIDAGTKKLLGKYATLELFDSPKKSASSTTIFAIANALKRGDKKALWIAYQRELWSGAAPEAIHGVMFWGVKDMMLKSRDPIEMARGKKIISQLAILPHATRRRGGELEYALEQFVLGIM